jgi:prepilin-type N-terminal cleavage/methylation domain-containing protein
MHMTSFSSPMAKQQGFSLVELMVSLTIFSIVMTIAVSTLLVLIDANAKAQALSSAMTNVTFALDSMSRNLRTGMDLYCSSSLGSGALPSGTQDCAGGSGIVFTPGFDITKRVAYRLNGTTIEQRIDRNGVIGQWVAITSNQAPVGVAISTLRFVLEGTQSSDTTQPRVTFLVRGYAQNGLQTPTQFDIQSRVTQRILDY